MKIFYAISTHWDREWYKPFQGFRYDLVKEFDKIIAALESGKMKVFTFDGQTVVLEDYIEIAPQNRKRIENLIRNGKLKIGPWYVMPDELLVSGESIIRNFLTGKKTASEFGGETWKYGYMNDIFGHIAQMPQILNGFGINAAYMGRGLGGANQNFKNFLWRSPDGSECFGYKERYAALLDEFKESSDKMNTVEEYLERESDGNAAVLLYTHDHIGIDDGMLEFESIKNALSAKYDIVEGLEGISEALKPNKNKLPVQEGELVTTAEIEGEFRAVTNSISAYYPIKFENDMCENLLESKTAPMIVWARLMKMDINSAFYHLAAKYLLKNQPHDSICGCSSETVHEDMLYRYSQVKSVSSAIERDIEAAVSSDEESKRFVSVINYSPKAYDGVFVTDLMFEKNWKNIKIDNGRYQEFCEFDILDEDKNIVPYQIIDIEKNYGLAEKPYIPQKDRYRVAMFSNLKPFGETVFEIVPKKPKIGVKTTSDGELSAENEYIKLEISHDGGVSIYDKESGKEYKDLNIFIDDGEIGNGWFSERPIGLNTTFSSKGAKTIVSIVRRGEIMTCFNVTKIMTVPKFTDYHTYKRSETTAELTISTDIVLKKGSKAVEFKTTVDNTVLDHRLRVEFPTDIAGSEYYASQAFTFLKRHRGVTESGANFSEPEGYEKNTSGIICVKDKKCGLSFVSKAGIHECGVSKNGVISATMLRSFGRFMFENSRINEKAQIVGKHTFLYALTTEKDFSALNDLKKNLFEVYSNIDVAENRKSTSFFGVEGNVNVSIVKPSENDKGYIIRLYNTKDVTEDCVITFKTDVKNVSKVNLAEEVLSGLPLKNNELHLDIMPNKIETIYFE